MSTPTQIKEDKRAAFQWWRLLDELGLPPETRWETIVKALADYRLIAEGAEAEISQLNAELCDALVNAQELRF